MYRNGIKNTKAYDNRITKIASTSDINNINIIPPENQEVSSFELFEFKGR